MTCVHVVDDVERNLVAMLCYPVPTELMNRLDVLEEFSLPVLATKEINQAVLSEHLEKLIATGQLTL